MYEFYIGNIYTGETRFVYGYNILKALEKAKLSPVDWGILYVEYVD